MNNVLFVDFPDASTEKKRVSASIENIKHEWAISTKTYGHNGRSSETPKNNCKKKQQRIIRYNFKPTNL